MKYFVTGASGFLGTHLVRLLVANGHNVTALVYEPEREETVKSLGARTIVGGFVPDLLERAMEGCDGVFHVAGFVSLNDREGKVSRAVNVEGVGIVLDTALKANVRRVVHTSSLVAIGASLEGTVLNEDFPWEIGHIGVAYINTKHEGEQLALSYNGKGLEVIVCNPSGMIGPHDYWGSQTSLIFKRYLKNRARFVADIRNNWADVRDVARGHILAMEKGTPGERYFLGNINTTLEDILDRLDRITGESEVRRAVVRWPWTLLIGSVLQLFSRESLLNAASARFMRYAFWISIDKAIRELGYDPLPIEETLAESLAWFHKKRGQTGIFIGLFVHSKIGIRS
jgi:dihydroflavonol-4-reductase